MELVERKFRDTPKENKKYAKRLNEYIDFLISKGKIIEAKHFFHILNEHKPDHPRTIRLGYSLSIASFDNEGVRIFDRLLCESKPKEVEIFLFRLKYYISVNNIKYIEESCVFLLSNSISNDCLRTIIGACINFESYLVVKNLNDYFERKRLKLSGPVNNRIRRIALQRLVEVLEEAKYG